MTIHIGRREFISALWSGGCCVAAGGPRATTASDPAARCADGLAGERLELPVQAPTKFEFVVYLKTAKAIDLDVPLHLDQLAGELRTGPRADSARCRLGEHDSACVRTA